MAKGIVTFPEPENLVRITDVLAKKRAPVTCRHARFFVDVDNRNVECKDCGKIVEPFEALIAIADRAAAFQQRYEAMQKDHRNLAGYVPRLRAVRSLEHLWEGKKLPLCPHCKTGVSAEAMAAMGWVHQRFAEAVQRDRADAAPIADVTPITAPSADACASETQETES